MKLNYKGTNLDVGKLVKSNTGLKITVAILSFLVMFAGVFSCLMISSAWFTDEKNLGGDVQMGSIDLNIFGNEKEKISEMPLTEILIANQQVFKYDIFLRKEETSRPMYARIYMEFTGEGSMELNDAVRRNLGSSADYKWEQIGPYFYLTDSSGTPINITGQAEYKFLTATKLKLPITVDSGLKLILNAKAIQSEGMGNNSPKNATELAEKMKDSVSEYHKITINITRPNEALKQYVVWAKDSYTIKNLNIKYCEVIVNDENKKEANEYTITNIQNDIVINIVYKENVIELDKIKNYEVSLIEDKLIKTVSLVKGSGEKSGKFKIAIDDSTAQNPCTPNYLTSGTASEFYYFEDVNNPSNKYYLSGIDYGGKIMIDGVEKLVGPTEFWYDIPSGILKLGAVSLTPNNFKGDESGGDTGGVVLGHCVTSIGDKAFYYCRSLTSITIPASVTSIGYRAFYYCMKLTSVTIPNSVTSIGNDAFDNCENLTSIIIPDGVTSIENCVFEFCYSLTSILIPDSVISIGNRAFYYCMELTSVTIPNSVTSIDYHAFDMCNNLKNVTIGSGVTSIAGSAFNGCIELTTVTIDSATIAGLNETYSNLYDAATTVYVKSGLTVGNEIKNKFPNKVDSDKNGYDKYTK